MNNVYSEAIFNLFHSASAFGVTGVGSSEMKKQYFI